MGASRLTPRLPSLRPVAAIVAAACAVAAAAATAVLATGMAADLRELLGLDLTPAHGDVSDAVGYAVANLRVTIAPLGCALLVGLFRRLRPVLDGLNAVLLVANAGLIGLALGAYGLDLVAYLVWHGPLELLAFAVAGAAYLECRRGREAQPDLVLGAALTAALVLTLAAALEAGWRPL